MRLRSGGTDEGFSLIEMLVVVVLLAVVGGLVTTAMISGIRNARQAQSRASSTEDVQTQLQRVSRDIRVGDPIRAASDNSITVDVYRGNTCVRQQWALTSGSLVSTATTYATWAACSSYPTTATPTSTVTRTALTSIANGATPIFTYENSSGATLSSPTPSQIAVVHITLMQAGAENRAAVSFDTSVGVRNATLK